MLFQKYLERDALLNFVSEKHGGLIGKKANVLQVERVSTDGHCPSNKMREDIKKPATFPATFFSPSSSGGGGRRRRRG